MNEHRNDAERTNSCIFSILSRIVFKKLYFTYYSLLSQVFTVSVAEHIDVVFLEKLALNDQASLVSDWSKHKIEVSHWSRLQHIENGSRAITFIVRDKMKARKRKSTSSAVATSASQSSRLSHIGTRDATKTDQLLEKIQTAFDPPSFSENYVAIFSPKSPV